MKRLLVLACLVVTLGGPAAATPLPLSPAPRAPSEAPPGETHVYRVTFEATVTHDVALNFGPGSTRSGTAKATVKGRLPDVRSRRGVMTTVRPSRTRLQTVSGQVATEQVDDEGRTRTTCVGDSIERGTFEHPVISMVPATSEAGTGPGNGPVKMVPRLTPFNHLTLLTECSGPEGPSQGVYSLPGIPLPPTEFTKVRKGVFTMRYAHTVRYTPDRKDEPCPDELPGFTDACTYTIDALATFRLKRILPQ